MTIAYVLINTEKGKEAEVLKQIRGIENIKEAHTVYGVYDLIVKVEANSMRELKKVLNEIRKIDNVRATMTTVCAESEKQEKKEDSM